MLAEGEGVEERREPKFQRRMFGATGAGGRGKRRGVVSCLGRPTKRKSFGSRFLGTRHGWSKPAGGGGGRKRGGEREEERQASGERWYRKRGTRSIYSRRHRHAGAPDEERCRAGRAGQGPASRCQAAGESWGKAICPFRVNVDRDSTRESRGGAGVVVDVFRHPARWRQVGAVLSAESMVRLDGEGTRDRQLGAARRAWTLSVRGRTTWGWPW